MLTDPAKAYEMLGRPRAGAGYIVLAQFCSRRKRRSRRFRRGEAV